MNRSKTRRDLFHPFAVLVAGLLAVALLIATRWLHLRTDAEGAAWVQAVSTIESDLAISHLWLEEHVSGDRVDLVDLDRRLDRSQRLIRSLLGQGEAPAQMLPRPLPADDGRLRQEAAGLEQSLRRFRDISEDRRLGLERGLAVGIGSSFDVAYDEVFELLLGHVQRLRAHLEIRRLESSRRETRTFNALAGAFTGLILLVSAVLWRRERSRLDAEAALDENHRQMARVQRTEAVGKLAGGLAHDLDNYLASIRAQCELALLKPETAEGKLQTVIDTVDRASSLIGRLLSFHRGARAEPPAPLDIEALLLKLDPMLTSALGRRVGLHLELPPIGDEHERWQVLADATSIEQVVINLAVNARDAIDGDGLLRIGLERRRTPGGDFVRLTVKDDGCGMERGQLDRIFEPFWSTKAAGHSGLGLSIVESVVHRLEGQLTVDSEPGAGTTFTIDLPRASSCVHGRSSRVASTTPDRHA